MASSMTLWPHLGNMAHHFVEDFMPLSNFLSMSRWIAVLTRSFLMRSMRSAREDLRAGI
jgi:hypothetical protein